MARSLRAYFIIIIIIKNYMIKYGMYRRYRLLPLLIFCFHSRFCDVLNMVRAINNGYDLGSIGLSFTGPIISVR